MNDTKYRRQAMLVWQEERGKAEEELRSRLVGVSGRIHELLHALKHAVLAMFTKHKAS